MARFGWISGGSWVALGMRSALQLETLKDLFGDVQVNFTFFTTLTLQLVIFHSLSINFLGRKTYCCFHFDSSKVEQPGTLARAWYFKVVEEFATDHVDFGN